MANIILYENLCVVFSSPRFSTYLRATNYDKLEALELYKLNLQLSRALYPLLSVFEINLRNRIVNVFVKYYGSTWFNENESTCKWLNEQESTLIQNEKGESEKRWELKEIKKAKDELRKERKPITSDRITAKLNFGFWVTIMVNKEYERSIWHHYIKEIFPHSPKGYNFTRKKEILRKKIMRIKKLRNRVFHHEPIFCTKELSFIELLEVHKDIIELIEWLSQHYLDSFEEDKHQFINFTKLIPSHMY
ncbi:Abi family protein [Nostoc parmelioides]|uniref:Abi family protein n=1 Tax=Nostoc parmelioides FACHB-3921 TaxID=2692909 RepID=A0ABR8BPW3_9NOSO|nr:Abi family protein [Nostoc parmelioides]MBD2255322.1 Abi family protein [Nostoc parmelioides FACHB-3921]